MHRLFRRLRGKPERALSYPLYSRPGRLRLDPIRHSEIPLVETWFGDHESCRLAFGVDAAPEVLAQMTQEYIGELHKDMAGVLMLRFSEHQADNPALGFVRYKLYRKGRRCMARVGIMLGDSRLRGQGLGSEAMGALLDLLFDYRAVDVVELDTADFNLDAQKCFARCGFELIRETEVIDFHDRWTERRHVMRLTEGQWRSVQGTLEFNPTGRPQS